MMLEKWFFFNKLEKFQSSFFKKELITLKPKEIIKLLQNFVSHEKKIKVFS